MPFNIMEILTYELGNNYVKDYLLALLVFISLIIVLKVFKGTVIQKLKKIAAKSKTDFDNLLIKIVEDIGWPFYIVLSLYFSSQFIQLAGFLQKALYYAVVIVFTYYAVRGLQSLIEYGSQKAIEKSQREEKAPSTVIDLLSKFLKVSLWGIAVIFLLSNLGYNVSTLVAGFGIGGIAIALAIQNILGDIFSSLSIYFDKPFVVGDFIIVGQDLGVVKKIGIKSTRIQTLQGQELVISNKELTSTRINNYKKMERRRIVFGFGIKYETPLKKVKKIPGIVKDIVNNMELAEADRVHFKEFGDFSLNFEIVYYLNSSEYNKYMDTQQEINFALKERFEKEGIEFAYPTQTVFVNRSS